MMLELSPYITNRKAFHLLFDSNSKLLHEKYFTFITIYHGALDPSMEFIIAPVPKVHTV